MSKADMNARIQKLKTFKVVIVLFFLMIHSVGTMAAENETSEGNTKLLWQIGKRDNDTREFALAPADFTKFTNGGFFVVGRSNPKTDWPYIHPGPHDECCGKQPHDFTIVFNLRSEPKKGTCRLLFDLVDTHKSYPPKLRIDINGRLFSHILPRGGHDKSFSGDFSKAREHFFDITFPANILKAENNRITITTTSGRCFMYDWIGFETPVSIQIGETPETLIHSVQNTPLIVEKESGLNQALRVKVYHFGQNRVGRVHVDGVGVKPAEKRFALSAGLNMVEIFVPAVENEIPVNATLEVGNKTVEKRDFILKPAHKWTVYLLPHSHTDPGFNDIQTKIERNHWQYYEQAIRASRRTVNYPPEAQFKWNVEVLWAVESYLNQTSPFKQKKFIEAVKAGWLGLDAFYGSELTGLCRPEELIQLVDFARQLSKKYGFKIDSAMSSDVPGCTWGIVPVLAQSGIKYLTMAPNMVKVDSAWGDRPFYLVSPCGKYKILCWVAGKSYHWFARGRRLQDDKRLLKYLDQLELSNYPYEFVQLRYTTGDNGPPETKVSKFVKDWNTKYANPKLIIATTSKMFHDFEERYADTIPVVRGDYTPAWEDGAQSAARETALNRAASERLVQAWVMWALLNPKDYPAHDFQTAWRNIVLFDEHTWGSKYSCTRPDSEDTKAQWKIKQTYALVADALSHELLTEAAAKVRKTSKNVMAVDVYNTSSWIRTDLVVLPKGMNVTGDIVKELDEKVVPSQRLSTGQLAFIAKDVPPFGAKRFFFEPGRSFYQGSAKAEDNTLSNNNILLTIDKNNGAIISLTDKRINEGSVNLTDNRGLNEYLYFHLFVKLVPDRLSGPMRIRVKESGPLVASLLIESSAPGCNKLTREVRIIDGIDRVDIFNTLDKKRIREKEAVHFAFPFKVPDGVMRINIPWAVIRQDVDQLRDAHKRFLSVQRWVDISNEDFGVTWVPADVPVIAPGRIIKGNTWWTERPGPTKTIYSKVMTNAWNANYPADQGGVTTFRYSIQPHGHFDSAVAEKFGVERSQPLIVVPVDKNAPIQKSLLHIEPPGVIVSALKPSEDGKAWIIRLYNISGRSEKVTLTWDKPEPKTVWLSNFNEEPVSEITGPIDMAAYEFVTIRASLPVLESALNKKLRTNMSNSLCSLWLNKNYGGKSFSK